MKNKIKVAFIGCGNMARAVIERLSGRAAVTAFKAWGYVLSITACDKDESKLLPVQKFCKTTVDPVRAVDDVDYVVVAVRPCDARAALSGLDLSNKVIISFAAGVSLDTLANITSSGRLVRCMPNINARVGEAYTAYSVRGISDERTLRETEFILGGLGMYARTDETLMSAATALAGSAPAFICSAINALCDEAVALGFAPDEAERAVVQIVAGSAAYYDEFGGGAKLESCTRGGTTEAGMAYLKENGFESVLRGAVRKAYERAEEIAQ